MSLLQAEGLRFERGGRVIFDGVSLSVRPGDRLAVTGPSGSGKTSLLAVVAGLAPPAAGTVRRDGEPVTAGTLAPRTAAVLQGYGLVSLLTAAENVEILLRAAGMPARQAMAAARTALAELGLGDYGEHLVQELSGGQQQRVAVARALAARPHLLIADEPTAEQDAATRELVLARLLATPVPCGASAVTARRSGLYGWAGYGYCPSHSRWYWGAKLLLICTCDGTVTGFGLANPQALRGTRARPPDADGPAGEPARARHRHRHGQGPGRGGDRGLLRVSVSVPLLPALTRSLRAASDSLWDMP